MIRIRGNRGRTACNRDNRRVIRKIVLENYMSHAHTVIEPAEGLTVLVGPNNCGKSAVVAALETLCFNPGGDYMVRHGARECAVTVETAEGHVVTWRRKGGAVSYTIDGREVGRLGRGGVPDDLHQVLRLPKVRPPDARTAAEAFDLHLGYQKSPVFLLDQSRGRAATFFASSSDAEKLLEMQRRHRDNAAAARRDRKRLDDEIEDLDRQVAALAPVDDLDADVRALEAEYEALNQHAGRVEALSALIDRLHVCLEFRAQRQWVTEALSRLAEPPDLADDRPLWSAARAVAGAQWRQQRQVAAMGALLPLLPPPELGDERSLGAAIGKKVEAGRRERQARGAVEALSPLEAPPPPPRDVEGIATAVAHLQRAGAVAASAVARTNVLASLGEPAPPADVAPLQDWSRRWSDAAALAERHAGLAAEVDQRLAALRAEAERWAQAHPTCPTCGGDVDADRLLTVGHQHDAEGGGRGAA